MLKKYGKPSPPHVLSHAVWVGMDDPTRTAALNAAVQQYRARGYPFLPTTQKYRTAEFQKLQRTDFLCAINESHRSIDVRGLAGLSLAWSYFPHHVSVACANGARTPMHNFERDDRLKLVMAKLAA